MRTVLLRAVQHMPGPVAPLDATALVNAVRGAFHAQNVAIGMPAEAIEPVIKDQFAYIAVDVAAVLAAPRPDVDAAWQRVTDGPGLWRDTWRPAVDACLHELDGLFRADASSDEAARDVDRYADTLAALWLVHAEVIQTNIALMMSAAARLHAFGVPDATARFPAIMDPVPNDIQAVTDALLDIGALIADDEVAVTALAASPDALVQHLLDRSDEAGVAFRAFWPVLRQRSTGRGALAPSWQEDPSPVTLVVRDGCDDRDAFKARRAAALAARDAATQRLRARVAPDDAAAFDAFVATAREAWALGSTHNLHIDDRGAGAARQAVMRAGQRLVQAGAVVDPVDVLFLEQHELRDALATATVPAGLVAKRREAYRLAQHADPPNVIGDVPPGARHPVIDFHLAGAGVVRAGAKRSVTGIAASPGVVEGRARVVRDIVGLAAVRRGDVIVALATEPAWLPALGRAGAVVTASGGALSHAAVVAREFGTPCVTGVADALEFIEDGRHVRVDGDAGTVTLIEPPE